MLPSELDVSQMIEQIGNTAFTAPGPLCLPPLHSLAGNCRVHLHPLLSQTSGQNHRIIES